MTSSLFVGNLAACTSSQELKDLFGRYAAVKKVSFSEGWFQGYALIEMESGVPTERAVDELHGFCLQGSPLTVSWAIRKDGKAPAAPSRGGGSRTLKKSGKPRIKVNSN